MKNIADNILIERATAAMKSAYAPYSHYFVGAALLTEDGEVFTGCNVENASYSVACCAERVALFGAVSKGKRNFSAIAVGGGKDWEITDFAYPCGVCRQALSEFCGDELRVILFDGKQVKTYTLGELFPHGFDGKVL